MVKGTIKGSFSRFLILKSSVPVMTARMRPSFRQTGWQPRVPLVNKLVPSQGVLSASEEELASRSKQQQVLKEQQADEGRVFKEKVANVEFEGE